MIQPSGFSCHLIGGDSLLIECGEVLLSKGHQIRSVVTSAPRLAEWAASKGLAVVPADRPYADALRSEAFDYLFSITHLALIPDEVLALPLRGAINFHDGPLPDYAGLYTPAWAIQNRETGYGITWHRISSGVDEGDILLQRRFDLAEEETSLSLNTRCFEAGLDSFSELVDRLRDDTVEPVAQDLSRRRYFAKHDRPGGLAVLDWTRPAAELHALVRALDFGRYPNPFGAAKLVHGGRAVVVQRTEIAEGEGAPGTVLSVDDTGFVVATTEGALRIAQAVDPERGDLVGPAELGVQAGAVLDPLTDDLRGALDARAATISRAEPRWERLLSELEPVDLPWSVSTAGAADHASIAASRTAGVDATVAAFALALLRICRRTEVTFGLVHDDLVGFVDGARGLVSDRALLPVEITEGQTLAQLTEAVAQDLGRTERRGTWLHDLFERSPALAGRRDSFAARAANAVVCVTATPDAFAPRPTDLVALVVDRATGEARIVHDRARLADADARRLVASFEALRAAFADTPALEAARADLLGPGERERILERWNDTARPLSAHATVQDAIHARAEASADRVAVRFEGESLTYAQLDLRARALAATLRARGVDSSSMVGVHVERSADLVVAVLGVLYAGAAYVPLDPGFPADRLRYMIEDAGLELVVGQRGVTQALSLPDERVLLVDEAGAADAPFVPGASGADDLAYVIYTSGSTGLPKGVMVEHRNVLNFFEGMDERVPHDPPGTWLAVTSLSFDISVLELLWTLSRGFEVVVYRDRGRDAGATEARPKAPMDFGIFLWGNDAGEGERKYELMLESAKFGDVRGFSSIWTPERHFHAFGGPFPNPSVTSAAIAAVTSRIGLRAGSCVSPLHHPIRIAEEWGVVDNLSGGRVGLSFASGWQPDDFVLRPENFADNKGQMFRDIDTVRSLWRGEAVSFPGPHGDVERVTLPRPLQPELPVWVTSAGNPETYRLAGEAGANVLTHLLGQSVEEVAEKIRIYREARAAAGHDPATGQVTLMLHTFIGDDLDEIRDVVRGPMKRYLASATNLVKKYAWSFPAFKRPEGGGSDLDDLDLDGLSEDEWDAMMEHAFERYFQTSGLFGTPESVQPFVDRLKEIGVTEIGCLIDYGIENDVVLRHLEHLDRARVLANPAPASAPEAASGAAMSLADQVERFGVTHMQCTPSMARMLLLDDENVRGLRSIQHLMIGGEAFPPELARELAGATDATITNMYGPTETTIWSSTDPVEAASGRITIGTPIANTRMYVLDASLEPMPVGAPGDLYIGGAGVVRGYLGRDELTSERFVPDPFVPGARMYATGDVASWREDGRLDFHGRSDHQVKIRGYRIELGEIEALIDGREDVRSSVVVVREDVEGDQRLVAYATSNGAALDGAEIRRELATKLPEYMVPSAFVQLDEMPLTPNAKVDRKALPAPEAVAARGAAAAEVVAPEGELENRIAAAWRDVLGQETIGTKDNFFDIGGHSLLVVRLHRILKEQVERPLALTDLYRFPTIHSLAEWLQADASASSSAKGVDRAQQRREAASRRRRLRR